MTSNGNSTREAVQIAVAPPAAQRIHRERCSTPTRNRSTTRFGGRVGRPQAGKSTGTLDRAELARSERRARSLDFRPAPPADADGAIHHRHGHARRNAAERLARRCFKEVDRVVSTITAGTGLPLNADLSRRRARHGRNRRHPSRLHRRSILRRAGRLLPESGGVHRAAPGQWGNAGRDSITGPAQFTLNASMADVAFLRLTG